jgi:hypothetical protein
MVGAPITAQCRNSNDMPPIRTQVAPLDLLTDRWLIEALRHMSSNPHVRDAAAAWLAAYSAALTRGYAEHDAQARADEALQRVIECDRGQVQDDSHGPDRPAGPSGGRTHG